MFSLYKGIEVAQTPFSAILGASGLRYPKRGEPFDSPFLRTGD
jgi:hypothetical protein